MIAAPGRQAMKLTTMEMARNLLGLHSEASLSQ